jgi:endonuclease YncB( thermonuclease family)
VCKIRAATGVYPIKKDFVTKLETRLQQFIVSKKNKTFMTRFAIIFFCFVPIITSAATLTGTVTKVHDGDTITIRDAQGRKETVSLADIDAPEKGQQHSRITQAALSDRIGLKRVRIEWKKRDDSGRKTRR